MNHAQDDSHVVRPVRRRRVAGRRRDRPRAQEAGRPIACTAPLRGAGNPPSVSAMAAAVGPGLVDINATLDDPGKHTMATGIVLTRSGLVLTNNHVIDGATVLRATDVGNGRTYRASVVGYDRSHDIARLEVGRCRRTQNDRVWRFRQMSPSARRSSPLAMPAASVARPVPPGDRWSRLINTSSPQTKVAPSPSGSTV